MKKNVNRYEYLTQTPVPQLVCRLAVPTILSMLVTGLYNSADTFFVGRISTQATAAVGLVFSVMAMIQALGFFCGQGSGSFLSRLLGAGKKQDAAEAAATGFTLALIIGVIVAVLGNLLAAPLGYALGAGPSTIHDTLIYMRIILIGAPFMIAQFVINNQLRYQGSAAYAMIGLLAGAIINIGLDPLLMFVFDLGVAGAAIATVSGQAISFVVLLIGSMHGENIHLKLSNVRMNRYYLGEIVNSGLPALFRQGLAAVSTLLLNQMAGMMGGDAAIAGMSVVTRVLMLLSSAMIGFGQGYQPVCGFNYGAGLYARVKEGFYFCVKYGTIFLTAMSALCLAFAPQIVGFFRDDPAVIAVGTVALRAQAVTLPLMATIVLANMMLQSMGKGLKASITSSSRNGIFFIPLILILPRFFGINGILAASPISDTMAFIMSVSMVLLSFRRLSTLGPQAAEE